MMMKAPCWVAGWPVVVVLVVLVVVLREPPPRRRRRRRRPLPYPQSKPIYEEETGKTNFE